MSSCNDLVLTFGMFRTWAYICLDALHRYFLLLCFIRPRSRYTMVIFNICKHWYFAINKRIGITTSIDISACIMPLFNSFDLIRTYYSKPFLSCGFIAKLPIDFSIHFFPSFETIVLVDITLLILKILGLWGVWFCTWVLDSYVFLINRCILFPFILNA